LKEIDFCAFNRFNQILEEAARKDSLQELISFDSPKKEEILMKNEYQYKFAKMMRICFSTDIVTINQLDVEKVMQQFENYDVGENLDPLEQTHKKSTTKSILLQKVRNYQMIISQKLKRIKFVLQIQNVLSITF
jgi:hypothetical protein